jgi:hypothetical protein
MVLLVTTGAAQVAQARANGAAQGAHRHALVHQAAFLNPAAREPVSLATTLAERYWGAVPCGGQVAVRANQPLAAGMEGDTDGWVTFESSLGPNDLQAPASTYTGCTISLAHWQWATPRDIAEDWNMFCLTVVHEMGHLLGHPHSLAPGSVMAPVFTDESSVPAICRAARAQVEAGVVPVRTR